MSKIDLNKDDLRQWAESPPTKFFMTLLNAKRQELNLQLTHADVVSDPKVALRIVGQREGLDLVLQSTTDDLYEVIQDLNKEGEEKE